MTVEIDDKALKELTTLLRGSLYERSMGYLNWVLAVTAAIVIGELVVIDDVGSSAVFMNTFYIFTAFAALGILNISLNAVFGITKKAKLLTAIRINGTRSDARDSQLRSALDLEIHRDLVDYYRECRVCSKKYVCSLDDLDVTDCETAQSIKVLEDMLKSAAAYDKPEEPEP